MSSCIFHLYRLFISTAALHVHHFRIFAGVCAHDFTVLHTYELVRTNRLTRSWFLRGPKPSETNGDDRPFGFVIFTVCWHVLEAFNCLKMMFRPPVILAVALCASPAIATRLMGSNGIPIVGDTSVCAERGNRAVVCGSSNTARPDLCW